MPEGIAYYLRNAACCWTASSFKAKYVKYNMIARIKQKPYQLAYTVTRGDAINIKWEKTVEVFGMTTHTFVFKLSGRLSSKLSVGECIIKVWKYCVEQNELTTTQYWYSHLSLFSTILLCSLISNMIDPILYTLNQLNMDYMELKHLQNCAQNRWKQSKHDGKQK